MKYTRLTFILLVVITLTACDKIKQPLPPKDLSTVAVVDTNKTIVKTNGNINYRKAFLEDYTGHQCGNCPQAAAEVESIKESMGDSLIVLAIHAGWFARTDFNFSTNYKTTVGTDWDVFFKISLAGNPNGMINRMNYPTNTHIRGYTTWRNLAGLEVKKPQLAKIELTTKYDSISRGVNVFCKTTFRQALSGEYLLNVVYFEDGIVGKQKFLFTNSPSIDSVGYIFNHVLRGDVNGSWGETLTSNPSANSVFSKAYLNTAIPATMNDRKTHIAVLVYNKDTKEVIQAEEVKIR